MELQNLQLPLGLAWTSMRLLAVTANSRPLHFIRIRGLVRVRNAKRVRICHPTCVQGIDEQRGVFGI